MLPPNLSDDQAIALLDQQISALKIRMEAGEKIIGLCRAGAGVLGNAPSASLSNIAEVTGALVTALRYLLESNLLANELSLKEISAQCEQLEKARRQRASPIHLGGFTSSRR